MIKKIISIFLALLVVLPLTACFGGVTDETQYEDTSATPSIESSEEITLSSSALTVIECGYLESARFRENALNYIDDNQIINTPWMFKAESIEELREIFNLMQPSWVHKLPEYDAEEEYKLLYGSYTEDFFEENALIIVYRDASSGGDSFKLSAVSVNNNRLSVCISQTSSGMSCDMSGWLFRLSIPKKELEGVTSYETHQFP